MREIWEETGLQAKLIGPVGWKKEDTKTNQDLVPPIYVNRHKINEHHDHSAFVFVAISQNREVRPQSEEDKTAEAKCVWVTQAELDEMQKIDKDLRPEVYKYASTALKLAAQHDM